MKFFIHPRRLTFKDTALEAAYREDIKHKYLIIFRFSCICAMVVISLFAILDFIVLEQELNDVLFIRFGLLLPAYAVMFGMSFINTFWLRYSKLMLSFGISIAGFGICGMIAVISSPAGDWYYAGLGVMFIYAVLARLDYIHSFVICLLQITAYSIAIASKEELNVAAVANNYFFLISWFVMTVFVCYFNEFLEREDFIKAGKIEEKRREAEAANRAKSDFLSVMSHELRSPLISVRGVAEMMEQQFLGPLSDKYRDYATDVRTSADHLVSIINDILDYSKMTGGKWELAAQDIDGAVLIQESITLIQGLLHEKNITVETRITAPLTLHLDTRLGRQMLTNLLSNAVKFSPEKSRIIVTLERLEDGAARISVTDHGKGIPEADLARVLLPFEQVSDPHQRDTGGTGLGLPFVVEAMRQHGGTLELESTVNVGTTVKLLFPAARVVAP